MRGLARMTATQGKALAAITQSLLSGGSRTPQKNQNQQLMKKLLLSLTAALVCGYVSTASAQLTQIFPANDPWKYSTDCHDGDGWQTSTFDDTSWLSGPGGFTGGENAACLFPGLNTRAPPAPHGFSQGGAAQYFVRASRAGHFS